MAYFFYQSIWAVIPLSPIGVLYYRQIKQRKAQREQQELLQQFKECILAVSIQLQAGFSIENAFLESEKDMRYMYGPMSDIVEELKLVRRGLKINITLEELLTDFGNRSNCPDIQQFARTLQIAKKRGGNINEMMSRTAGLISRKVETREEIYALLSGRKMEFAVMKGMPFFILIYLNLTTNGFFDNLYHNLKGIMIMTLCLGLYLAAYLLGNLVINRIESGI